MPLEFSGAAPPAFAEVGAALVSALAFSEPGGVIVVVVGAVGLFISFLLERSGLGLAEEGAPLGVEPVVVVLLLLPEDAEEAV